MYRLENTAVFIIAVAPFTGARVETNINAIPKLSDDVAPFTGARVETNQENKRIDKMIQVAPFTGARVET